ncbi:MAG: DUF4163 domain-containing protein [Sphingomonadales bacterium]|nr:DUF4163 domain-containing protein [Sphingomonadales bacterium]
MMLLPLAALAGCHKAADEAGGKREAAGSPAPPSASAPAAGVARKVEESNRLFEFNFDYPAAAAAIPGLKAQLDADLTRARADIAASAREGAADAKAAGIDFNAYESGTNWQVVTDLPGWLSLSAQVYEYSGGAHPNHGFAALLWDKAAGTRRAAADLFASKAALTQAIQAPFCDALDKERTKRRGAPVNRASGDEFDDCIDPAAATVILGSSNHATFDRVGVLVAPYEAGPYAEGDYEITLPVTPAVLAAVKPAYRQAFSIHR